ESLAALRRIAARNTESVGALLAGFFRHFAWDFDFGADVVSVRLAAPLPKCAKAEFECWAPHRRLAIEDPFETFYDVAHVLKHSKHQQVRLEFLRAHDIL
ncbi:hypothetical protein M885DRAFT_414579, partial [Pelagophyceae sp. CCMP2097]